MKKIPLLLSTLTLATGVNGLTNALIMPTAPVLAADTAETTDAVQDIYLEGLNEVSEYLQIDSMNFETNRLEFSVGGSHVVTENRSLRALIVMRDYEAGVTEAEAKEASKTLGVGDTSWYKKILELKRVSASNNTAPKIPLKENITDVIYFAIQYGKEVTDENGKKTIEGEHWVRGMIDYRKCIHSPSFNAETMVCSVDYDSKTKTAVLAAKGIESGKYVYFPEGEEVLSWEEELKAAMQERITGLNTQLTHVKKQLSSVGSTLFQAGKAINNMQKLASEMEEKQDLDRSLTQLQTLWQQVQNAYDWMVGPKQQEYIYTLQADMNAASAEIERLKQELATAAANVAQAEQNLVNVTQEWQATQNELDVAKADNQQVRSDLAEAKAELEKLRLEAQALQLRLAEAEAKLGQGATDAEAAKAELAKIQERLAEILQEKEKIMREVQVLTSDKEVLVGENSELQQKNADLKAENSDLQQKNTGLKAENAKLVVQNEALQSEIEAQKAKIRELEAKLAEKSSCTVVGEVRVGDEPLNDAENENAVNESAENSNNSTSVEIMPENAEVEVPNLGEVETKTNIWWVLVAVVAALGVLGVCCKKRLDRER